MGAIRTFRAAGDDDEVSVRLQEEEKKVDADYVIVGPFYLNASWSKATEDFCRTSLVSSDSL